MGAECVDWFYSYLPGRQQCIDVNGATSDFNIITWPLLYLCYVNDLEISVNTYHP